MLESDLLYIANLIKQVDRGELLLVRQMSYKERNYWFINCPSCSNEGTIKCNGTSTSQCRKCNAWFAMLTAITVEHAVLSKYPKMLFFLRRVECDPDFNGTTVVERLRKDKWTMGSNVSVPQGA